MELDHFRAKAEDLLSSGAYERWYEWDERDARGVCENLLVEAVAGSWALFRMAEDAETAIAVSILTGQQYQFNRANLWSRAIPKGPRSAVPTRKPMEPLTHNPFAKLGRR